jgi:hypothetical protein
VQGTGINALQHFVKRQRGACRQKRWRGH